MNNEITKALNELIDIRLSNIDTTGVFRYEIPDNEETWDCSNCWTCAVKDKCLSDEVEAELLSNILDAENQMLSEQKERQNYYLSGLGDGIKFTLLFLKAK